MLFFSIIIYTLFGGLCIWFIISGVQKIKQIKNEQEQAASEKDSDNNFHKNPIITNIYTADPAPMVYGDTLYLYTTHD